MHAKYRSLVSSLAYFAALLIAPGAHAVVINASNYPVGTNLTNAFPGITLESAFNPFPTGMVGEVYTSPLLVGTNTAVGYHQQLTFNSLGSYTTDLMDDPLQITDWRAFEAAFAHPVKDLTLQTFGLGDIVVMYPFDSHGNVLTEAVPSATSCLLYDSTDDCVGVASTITLTSATPISFIIVGSVGDGAWVTQLSVPGVPEPPSIALLAGGLLAIGLVALRRRQAKYRCFPSALVLVLAVLLMPLAAHAEPSFYIVTLATGNLVNPAVNDSGQSTGAASVYSAAPGQPPINAFLYNSDGTKVDLGTLGAHGTPAQSAGIAINNLGQVTGWTTVTTSYGYKAFLYSNGTMQDLGTFAPLTTEAVSIPADINNLGQVVGFATAGAAGEYLAFLYRNGKMQDLGTLGGLFSSANGINDSSEVVGISDTGKSGYAATDAFLDISGSMYNLNSLIGNADSAVWLTSATEINNQGQILADGVDRYNGGRYTYLLTPTNTPPTCGTLCTVSEPGTFGLFGLSLVGLGLTLRRRALLHH